METIEDILREMRSIKGGQHTNGGRSYEIWRMLCKVADDYADRIEAAAKEMREENARLRECLSEAVSEKCYCCEVSEDDRRELCDQCIVADWKEAMKGASK